MFLEPTRDHGVPASPDSFWESSISKGQLRGYIEDVASDIDVLKGVLTDYMENFAETKRLAGIFSDAVSRGDHVYGLRDHVGDAIYSSELFGSLQQFADSAEGELTRQANVYRKFGNKIMEHMGGYSVESYAESLNEGAFYCESIAQMIQLYFKRGGTSKGRQKVNSHVSRIIRTSGWSESSLDELLVEMGFCDETGSLNLGEDEWAFIEYLTGIPYDSMTDDMLMALSTLYDRLNAIGNDNDITRFFHLLAREVDVNPPAPLHRHERSGNFTEWEIDPRIIARLQGNMWGMAETARQMEQNLTEMGMEEFFRQLGDEERANLISEFHRATGGELALTDEALWGFLIEGLRRQQNNSLSGRAVLYAVNDLESITGDGNATVPNLTVIQDPDGGFTVSADSWKMETILNPTQPAEIRTRVVSTVTTITPPIHPYDFHTDVLDVMEASVESIIAFNPIGNVASGVESIAMGQVLDMIPGGSVANSVVNLALITFVTGPSDADTNTAMLNDHVENVHIANMAGRLGFSGIIIDNGSGVPHLMIQAGVHTEERLAHYNSHRGSNVEMEDLYQDPSSARHTLFPGSSIDRGNGQ